MSHWKYVVRGWGTVIGGEPNVFAIRDQLVALLRESEWYASQKDGEQSELAMRIRDLETSETSRQWDDALWEIYNLADEQRAWLDPDS